MINTPEMTAKVQIRNLLIVIGSGVVFAFIMAAMMLKAYGPSGQHQLQNVLLSPETAKVLQYDNFVFDHVEYSAWNPEGKTWTRHKLSFPFYRSFYSLIAGDQSLEEVSGAVEELFNRNPAALTVFIRSEENTSHPHLKIFQIVQFGLDGNHYRVELLTDETNKNATWAYFHHEGFENHFLQLFAQENED